MSDSSRAGKGGQNALRIQGSVDLFAHRSEIRDRQSGIRPVNDRSNRLRGLFRRASYLHVEMATGIAAFQQREVRLLRLLAKPPVAEVRNDSDDLDVRLRIGS
jgi:hypothetical protein